MVRKGMATTAVVAVIAVVLVGATVFGYMVLVPGAQHSSGLSTPSTSASSTAALGTSSTAQGTLKISNAALSNGSILVTIQNTGSQAVSLDSLLVTPGSGCLSSFARTNTTTTSQAGQNRSGFALPTCLAMAAVFLVQSNSTLRPVPLGRFNFTRVFNSTTFSRNSSRTFSANSSRTFSGNFTRGPPGNFSGIFPGGFLGNLSGVSGFQLAAGQAVTLAYSGAIGSGVATGSQYTITVTALQGEAQITLSAS
ncbi:MAG: hypothetical protein OK442_03900 [Thaumarchaeota archaeon]|nr:hypothetical protein [Nitrososphaerota archaeon]